MVDEMLDRVGLVLGHLKEFNLTIKLKKTYFFQSSVVFLGHVLQSSQQVFLKNKSVFFFCAFFHGNVFCCGKVFFVLFLPSKCVFFSGGSRVLQFNITISGFLGTSLINLH